MGNSTSLYGSIGYTYLQSNTLNPKFILVLSDNHSKLPYCNNYNMISEWLKGKTKTNNILLEEVPRNNIILKELFMYSDHTQKLKELFIKNPTLIQGIDIRPLLIKFSWELLELADIENISLVTYLEEIESFFNYSNEKIKKLNKNYNKEYITNSQCIIQFNIIKEIYFNFKKKYNNYLDWQLLHIFNNNINILEELNLTLDNIMEFYIVLNIFTLNNNKNTIIHSGLAHSNKIIFWLTTTYFYKIIEEKGITKLENII